MKPINNILRVKKMLITISTLIVSLILLNTYNFLQKFKKEERLKMEIFAEAIKEMTNNTNLNKDFSLVTKVYENINNIPSILIDSNNKIIAFNNLDNSKTNDTLYLKKQLEIMKAENKPIPLKENGEYVYYRDSNMIYQLTYYPIALVLILVIFLTIIYLLFNSNKIAEQNKLWTGMAKETAHQIGTPLSSLMGWTTILKAENVNPIYVTEIEKDIDRLNTIANRFSKIGSRPNIEDQDIIKICQDTFNYIKSRSSKKIQFNFETSHDVIKLKHNKELIGWVIENLTKNALDAIQQGSGEVSLKISKLKNGVSICLKDTGKGISRSKQQTVFSAGYTTKKRGWGLGLSLSKRIIEDYHKGIIFVKNSVIGKGTEFEILLNNI